jgi:heptosyltransferase-3
VDTSAHRVEAVLTLADVLGIPRAAEVIIPRASTAKSVPSGDIAVIHAAPMFHYKRWTAEAWRSVAHALSARGLTVVATGGPAPAERAYLDVVWKGTAVVRMDGDCTWGQLAGLLTCAKVYVGPDTSVTHLAAAAGCPTVALYGPTDPRLWGPWPIGGLKPWLAAASVQNRGNVWIVQHPFPCTPCQLEGCDRGLSSESECLKQLAPAQVISAIEQALVLSPLR